MEIYTKTCHKHPTYSSQHWILFDIFLICSNVVIYTLDKHIFLLSFLDLESTFSYINPLLSQNRIPHIHLFKPNCSRPNFIFVIKSHIYFSFALTNLKYIIIPNNHNAPNRKTNKLYSLHQAQYQQTFRNSKLQTRIDFFQYHRITSSNRLFRYHQISSSNRLFRYHRITNSNKLFDIIN